MLVVSAELSVHTAYFNAYMAHKGHEEASRISMDAFHAWEALLADAQAFAEQERLRQSYEEERHAWLD